MKVEIVRGVFAVSMSTVGGMDCRGGLEDERL